MAFSLSGSVITQSGTDTNLTGMSAIAVAGFVYYNNNGITNVTLNQTGARLLVNGTLTIPMDTNQLTIGNAANLQPILIGNGGILRLQYSTNGVNHSGFGIKSSHLNQVFWGNGVIVVSTGGLLELLGSGVYSIGASINFNTGSTFRSRNGILRGGQVGGVTAMFRLASGSVTYDIDGLTLIDYTFVCDGVPTFTNLKNLIMQCTVSGTNNVAFIPQGTMTIIGPQYIGNFQTHIGTSLQSGTAQKKTVYGYDSAMSPLIGKVPDYNTAVNWVEGRKIMILNVKNNLNENQNSIITNIDDFNNSKRYNGTPIGASNYTSGINYQATSNASGNITIDFLLWEVTGLMSASNTIGGVAPAGNVNSNMVVDYRWNGDTHNYLIEVPLKSYDNLPNSITVDCNGLAQTVNQSVFVQKDNFITKTLAVASALTTISTLEDLYDASKVWSINQLNFAYPSKTSQIINANGKTLDLDNLNLIIQNTGVAFNVNIGSASITINSTLLSGTLKFNTIKTNGIVTFSGNVLSNIIVQANATQTIPTDLSNIELVGTLTYNTNTDITVTFTNCNIGTIKNDGTGIVTITNINSTITDYTDPQINFLDSVLNFTGINELKFYPTQLDRDNNTNLGFTTTANPLNFKFGSFINGITMSGIVYLRATIGSSVQLQQFTLLTGVNTIDLSDNSLLQGISSNLQKVNRNVIKSSKFKTANETF